MNMIVGYEKEKKEIGELQKFLLSLETYKRLGVRIPRGIVFEGEPGVGKTRLARSIACEGISLIEVRAADCCEDESEALIQNAFEEAKGKVPAVVLLDELDKIAGTSRSFFMEGNDNIRKILLQELDKLCENDGVLVVATCNDMESLGDALLRSGRFDRILHISKPDEEDRVKILDQYFSSLKIERDFKSESIAGMTAGYTGAELECIVNECGIKAFADNSDKITLDTFRKVMNKLAFKSAEDKPIADAHEKYKVAIHEAGHVLVAILTMRDKLYGASILPQGESSGHVHFSENSKKIPTVSDSEDLIALALAGRIAEREILEKIYLTSSSDLCKAASYAKKLIVCHAAYGYDCIAALTEKGGLSISEAMLYKIEKKVSETLEKQDSRVVQMILSNRRLLEKIADELMNKTVLSRDELLALIPDDKLKIA